jgi:hypothetical protein
MFRGARLKGVPSRANQRPTSNHNQIISEKDKEYAAFSHFVWWLDDRYAITSTMQTGNTSLTPTGWKVIGPSVWLIDAVEGKGKMIIGPAKSPNDPGIYKPASDDVVVGKKLYVGEEDSMDETVDQSNVSVWDISDPNSPKFIKRLQAGKQLPVDFKMAHEIYASMDGRLCMPRAGLRGISSRSTAPQTMSSPWYRQRTPDGICLTATSSKATFDSRRS